MDIIEAKNEVLEAGQELVDLGLVARTWGNISCRIDEHRFAITPSGIGYERLTLDTIVVVEIDSLAYEGDIIPSSEKRIHAAAYKQDSDTNFIIHTHQTYATCISISGFDKLAPTEEELTLLGGNIGLAAYGISGTKKLTGNVISQITKGSHAILMANHGAILIGSDRNQTFKRASILEGICHRTMSNLPDFDDKTSSDGGENIRSAIRSAYPEFTSIMLLASENLRQVMEETDMLPAIIDDFVQIIGYDMKTAEPNDVIRKLKKRNAVYIKGLGAFCCAGNDSDCHAMMTLTEKNALAYLNATRNGDSPKLSFFDKKLMRSIYLKKYSSKK